MSWCRLLNQIDIVIELNSLFRHLLIAHFIDNPEQLVIELHPHKLRGNPELLLLPPIPIHSRRKYIPELHINIQKQRRDNFKILRIELVDILDNLLEEAVQLLFGAVGEDVVELADGCAPVCVELPLFVVGGVAAEQLPQSDEG